MVIFLKKIRFSAIINFLLGKTKMASGEIDPEPHKY